MRGWRTRTFTERVVVHHRKMGTGEHSAWRALVRLGQKDYRLGNHPLWEAFRALYQMKSRPYIIGGMAILGGYLASFLLRDHRPVPREVIGFCRREQIRRLGRALGLGRIGKFHR